MRTNLRFKLGDVITVQLLPDIHFGSRVHILPLDDSIEGMNENLFDAFLKPYFMDQYRPVRNNDLFIIRGGMKSVEFKIVMTNLEDYCVVALETEIFWEGEPVKREDEERLNDVMETIRANLRDG